MATREEIYNQKFEEILPKFFDEVTTEKRKEIEDRYYEEREEEFDFDEFDYDFEDDSIEIRVRNDDLGIDKTIPLSVADYCWRVTDLLDSLGVNLNDFIDGSDVDEEKEREYIIEKYEDEIEEELASCEDEINEEAKERATEEATIFADEWEKAELEKEKDAPKTIVFGWSDEIHGLKSTMTIYRHAVAEAVRDDWDAIIKCSVYVSKIYEDISNAELIDRVKKEGWGYVFGERVN